MSRRIIAVDDSDIALDVIQATLSAFGFDDIVAFTNPLEALEAISSGKIFADLILLDVMMPEMDGIELCARIRGVAGWADIPILMLSSRSDIDALSRALMAGANDYITKPFEGVEVRARINSSLRLKAELERRERSNSALPPPKAEMRFPQVLAGRTELESALLALGPNEIKSLSLIAMRPDTFVRNDIVLDSSEKSKLIDAVGQVLSEVNIAAGDLFCYVGDGCFCYACLRTTHQDLVKAEERFITHLKAAKILSPADTSVRYVGLCTGVMTAGENVSVGELLSEAIRQSKQRSV